MGPSIGLPYKAWGRTSIKGDRSMEIPGKQKPLFSETEKKWRGSQKSRGLRKELSVSEINRHWRDNMGNWREGCDPTKQKPHHPYQSGGYREGILPTITFRILQNEIGMARNRRNRRGVTIGRREHSSFHSRRQRTLQQLERETYRDRKETDFYPRPKEKGRSDEGPRCGKAFSRI